MTGGKLIKKGTYFIKLASLILSTQTANKNSHPYASCTTDYAGLSKQHQHSSLPVISSQLTICPCSDHGGHNIRPITNHGPLDQGKKPQLAFSIHKFHKRKGKRHNK
jgi:hypothetical protein